MHPVVVRMTTGPRPRYYVAPRITSPVMAGMYVSGDSPLEH
jgi:hypothetical protein